MTALRKIILGVALLVLTACVDASAPPRQPPGTVTIGPHATLTLPVAADLGRTFEADQMVTARYGAHSFAFQAHISATPQAFRMVCMDMLGQRLLTITWDAAGIDYQTAPFVPPQLRAENILADMVMLYWPTYIVQRGLSPGAIIVATMNKRVVTFDGAGILEAEFKPKDDDPWTGGLHYYNIPFGYDFTIQSKLANDP